MAMCRRILRDLPQWRALVCRASCRLSCSTDVRQRCRYCPRCRSLCGKRREPRHRTCLHDVGSRSIFARGYHVKESNEHASHRDFLQHSCLRHHPPWLAVQLLFIGNERPEIQLASVMYNATTDDEEHLADHHYKIDNSSYQD